MFNDIDPQKEKSDLNNSNPINNNSRLLPKKEVDDIFAETEEVEKPAVFKPKSTPPTPEQTPRGTDQYSTGRGKKIFVLAIIIAGGLILGSGGYLAYDAIMDKLSGNTIGENNLIDEEAGNGGTTQDQTAGEENKKVEQVVIPQMPKDSDQDGLSDEEETALGTDIYNADSDNDGLYDRDEVKVYKTNPLLWDTDGDGFSDGDEVKAGYDPNGPGKLYEIE